MALDSLDTKEEGGGVRPGGAQEQAATQWNTGEYEGQGHWGEMGTEENHEALMALKGKGKGPQKGSRWTCGGPHFARDCPKGKGKGYGKAGAPSKGYNKGKGKGPKGGCHTCGGPHYQSECPKGKGKGGWQKGGLRAFEEAHAQFAYTPDPWQQYYPNIGIEGYARSLSSL